MKTTVIFLLVAGVFVAMSAPFVQAQRAGFVVGIAPSGVNPAIPVTPPLVVPGFNQPVWLPMSPGNRFPEFSPVVPPFVVAPVQPFFNNPGLGFPPTQAPATAIYRPHRFSNTQLIAPGVVIVPGAVISPGAVIVPQPQGYFYSGGGYAAVPAPAPPTPQMPPIGASRAYVVGQLGSPSMTVITRDGETLYYNGGITVFIQNGQVARTR